MKTRVRILLAAMMFLEYAVWGAWTPVLGATLSSRLNATGSEIGAVYGVLWLACIITPFIGGQLVDRFMPSQIFLSLAAAVCALAAFMMAHQQTFGGLILWMWVWSIAYAPTLGITNSIAFRHLSTPDTTAAEQERSFAVIRTAGTLGWIIATWTLSAYLSTRPVLPKGQWAPYEEMQLAAVIGVLLAVFAVFLPHTPPAKDVKDPWAFTKAFQLFKTVPGFTAFVLISFVVSTEFQFFYVLSGVFLSNVGVTPKLVPITTSISQIAEIISLAVLLPIALKNLGMRKTLVIGVFAWPLRYLIFSLEHPLWLVIASLALHGVGYAFVFITSQIYVDRVAPRDIRASAQSLLTLVTLGLSSWLGTMFCGWLKDHYTQFVPDPAHAGQSIPGPVNWPMIFLVPATITILCGIAFWFTFHEVSAPEESIGTAELEAVGA